MKLSTHEFFNAIMNGEDFDNQECTTPDIDVEINIIQKEIDAKEFNEAISDAECLSEAVDKSEDAIEEAEMLINILRNDGVNPLVIKILSSRKIYTSMLDLRLPSIESLDTVGTNRYQAELLANSLEGLLNKIKDRVTNAVKSASDKLQFAIRKFSLSSETNNKKIQELQNKINAIPKGVFNDIKDGEITILSIDEMSKAGKLLNKVNSYKWDSTFDKIKTTIKTVLSSAARKISRAVFKDSKAFQSILEIINESEFENSSVDIKEIANDLKKGKSSIYYKTASSAFEMSKSIANNFSKIVSDVLKKIDKANDISQVDKNIIKNFVQKELMKVISKTRSITLLVQSSYLKAATKLLASIDKKYQKQ